MSGQDSRTYYHRRQRQEEAAAGAAAGPEARRIHQELAARYEARGDAGADQEIWSEPRVAVAA